MKVKVGLGKNASSSAAIKVGGTMSEPSYKIDVASTVSSLLGGLKKDDNRNSSVKQQAENVKNAVKDVSSGIKNRAIDLKEMIMDRRKELGQE